MLNIKFRKYDLRFQLVEGRQAVFDISRKKYVALTPEEWVRQHWLHYLAFDLNYPKGLIMTEYTIKWNQLDYRADIVVFNRQGEPILIVECKAPEIKLSDETAWQIARYNRVLAVSYMVLSNGKLHLGYQYNDQQISYNAINQLPMYTAD